MAYYSTQITEQADETKLTKFGYWLFYIAILSSGYVSFEPAPFDLLILLTIFLMFFTNMVMPQQLKWVLTISFINLMGSFAGIVYSAHYSDSYMHIIVTTYMSLFAIGLIFMVYNDPHKVINILIKAYVWAALISTILAIMGYFHIGPTYDLFTLYGRAKGGFKDPNVYGPFIVPPMLYLLERVVNGDIKGKIIAVSKFNILLLGLLLSFSRGAWGVFLFSTFIMLASMYYTAVTNRFRVYLSLYILISITFMVLALVVALNIPTITDLLSERASLSQSYDVEEGGRFTHHIDALKILIENPLGIGAKEFGWTHNEDVHNTYLTQFLIGGWVAGFSYLFIVFSTIIMGFKYCFQTHALRKLFVVFYATFISLSLEAWIIDIDHWRILYVLLGVIWGVIFYQKNNSDPQKEYR
ncbi:MAG: hypothetical protein COB24_01865 [Hyphomicrobiales bacterium]|nr:MAG: hypothetical protein COB24_01865 [Hyphomicrobiales bacterium]